jgi:hypothetical protein
MRALFLAATLCAAFLAARAHAASNYTATFFGPNQQQVTNGYKTLDQLIEGLKDTTTRISPSFDLSLRGLPAFLGTDGPTFLALDIPSLGIQQSFSGQTADETFEQLKRFLTQGSQAGRIARESARTSPFDPVAGNPTSLMARAVFFDFFNAFYPFASNITEESAQIAQLGGVPTGAVRGPFRPLPGTGGYYGHFRDQGLATQSLTVPLSLTLRSDLDPRRQFSLTLPLTVSDVEGARAYYGTLNASLRLPLARTWALTGALGYSVVSATDLGTAGQVGSAALTSAFVVRTAFGDLSIGNMVGHYRTLSGTISGISTDSKIQNTVFRNGVLWSERAPAWLGGQRIEYTLVNTHYVGTELYLKNYSEVGVMIGSNKRADSVRSYMQGGLTYLFSSKTKGVQANFGYWF